YPGGVLDQNYWQREYYTSWALLYAPVTNWIFDYSADYFHNNLNSNLVTDTRPYRNSVLQSATAKYRGKSLTIMARLLWSIYLNGAKDGTSAKDARKISPSLSLSWKPLSSQLLYLRGSYKNIFRMPTFNEAYFDHYGSTDILPETTDQLNIGATYTLRAATFLPQATFTLDGYVNNIHDMIVAVPFNMFVWSMVNLGKVRTYGIDATAEVTVSPARKHDVTFNLNYSLQRAMPLTSPESSEWKKQVAYIPLHSGSAAISYENPWVNITLSGTGVSKRYTTNNNLPATRIDGYMEFGVTAWRVFTVKSHTIDIRADIQNIFNKQYYIVARYPMPGRQYKISIAFSY
ncbi:MAG: TonB-dependent receptor, partial [Muribaculaceae bacterium]|nr:TonB-dependent receptor [Muribaculaceae bacterium]